MSVWALVLLTVERLVAVWLPLRCKQVCSRRRLVIAFSAIAALLFSINAHFLFIFELTHRDGRAYCIVIPQLSTFYTTVWYVVDLIVGDLVPFVAIFTGNCVIVANLVLARRQRIRQMHVAENDASKVVTNGSYVTYCTSHFCHF